MILGPILVTTQEAGSTRVVGIAKDLTLVVGIWLKVHGMNGSARATTLAPTLAACNIPVIDTAATMSFSEQYYDSTIAFLFHNLHLTYSENTKFQTQLSSHIVIEYRLVIE